MTIQAVQGSYETEAPAAPTRRRRWRGRPRPSSIPAGPWPELVARLLAMRGITAPADAEAFLSLDERTPDPYQLPDLALAVERLLRAVRERETVAVFGDFDVDGVTATAQLVRAITSLGGLAQPYLPDRFREGYGLNVPAIERLRAAGATVLVTADCGTSSVEEVARARAIGMDVIILDHHTVPPVLPDANALVNPRLPSATPGPMLELATAGLAFHLAAALHEAAGAPFEAPTYLDVAALGTVCDMAPLVDENRRIMRIGLPALARTRRPGLRALMAVSRIDPGAVSAEDIGYRLGPRLNAAGRIEHARLALDLLMTDDGERGEELAQRLDALNRERQQRTDQAVALAQHLIGDAEPPPLIMIGHADFSSGIVGLIASKLVSLYARPSVVYERGEETSRASCRSVDGFHITDAMRRCPELFLRFGGHRAAAGFTADNRHLDEIRFRLVEAASEALTGRELAPVLDIDCQLPLRALRGDEIRAIAQLGPFGVGNPTPVFLARDVLVTETRWVGNGEKHRRLRLRDGNVTWTAAAFDMPEVPVAEGDRVDVVYSVECGRPEAPAELRVEDLRPAEPRT